MGQRFLADKMVHIPTKYWNDYELPKKYGGEYLKEVLSY